MLASTSRFLALNRALVASTSTRALGTSSVLLANRAIAYTINGDPSSVLSAVSFPDLSPPSPNTANIRFILSAINPADINVIEGIYPARPVPNETLSRNGLPTYVAGNEGLAEVVEVGDGVTSLVKGDWVVMTRPQSGTWTSATNVDVHDVFRLPSSDLTAAQAATITVNPPTAFNMLHDFVKLKEGDWVIQNGANSAVGQAVIQIAAAKGLKTINFIRDRDNVESVKAYLKGLGATHVATYQELADKAFKSQVKTWTDGSVGSQNILLGLNCVSGKYTTLMARLLGDNAHLVSYGAMSKEPFSLPTSLFIFKNLTCHGFWQSRWYSQKTAEERAHMMNVLAELTRTGKLQSPNHEIVTIAGGMTDQEARDIICTTVARLAGGKYGKKVLLRVEETIN
ncbi:hypothetical protein F5I97DRAFT_1939656 [Phlebopus sp. FC_14]|nr:hypothetical protein F5I97DRAFT_1939656 [Phlebopus sp. FC_14]